MYLSEIRYLQATRQNLPLHYDIKRSNRVGKMLETKLNVNCVDSIFSMKKWCVVAAAAVAVLFLLRHRKKRLAWKNPCMVVLLGRC